MFSYNQSHELRSSAKCARCGHDFVKLMPLQEQTILYEEVRYYLQCSGCQSFRYGTETWDIGSALAIIDSESMGGFSERIDDEPLDLSTKQDIGHRLYTPLVEGSKLGLPSASKEVAQQRAYSPQPGTSSGHSGLGMARFRPDLADTADSDSEDDTGTVQSTQYLAKSRNKEYYNCDICGRGFVRREHYIGHRATHTDKSLYKCDICARGFAQKGHLKLHQPIHSSVKPFRCKICGRDFILRINLIEHICI